MRKNQEFNIPIFKSGKNIISNNIFKKYFEFENGDTG